MDHYRARLVAFGNQQEVGIGYNEMFAPIAKITTVCILLALAAAQSWPLFQMDVKNAFLHGDLKENIYMRLPLGLPSLLKNMVCKLRRSLYRLKAKARRAWFGEFRETLLEAGFLQC